MRFVSYDYEDIMKQLIPTNMEIKSEIWTVNIPHRETVNVSVLKKQYAMTVDKCWSVNLLGCIVTVPPNI
jgi:hypothetical protein